MASDILCIDHHFVQEPSKGVIVSPPDIKSRDLFLVEKRKLSSRIQSLGDFLNRGGVKGKAGTRARSEGKI